MKKSGKIILIVLCIIILFTGIYFIFKDNTKTTDILKNAAMIIKEGTLTNTGCTVIITDTEKEETHTYGESFSLEIKKDNKWQNLKPIIKDAVFNLIGYNVNENNELQQDISWEWLYGKLEPGEYRLVKDAAINYKNSYLGSGVVYAEFTIEPNLETVKLGFITNELTNTISINNDESSFILNLFNKYEYTTETCDGTDKYNLIIDGNTYGIEVYGYGMSQYNTEIHITNKNKELVLNKEDSLELLKIINTYAPDKFKPILECIKQQLGGLIANLTGINEKDITSLIKIDESKLDYSFLEMNENGDFYLIVKANDKNILKEITRQLEAKYKKIITKSYEGYELYVYNGNDDILQNLDLNICQLN